MFILIIKHLIPEGVSLSPVEGGLFIFYPFTN